MKQYVIDELSVEDHNKIKTYLDENSDHGAVSGIYQMPLPEKLLNARQMRHTQCQPFYFAIELENNRITYEFLVRSANQIRCDCIAYADERQYNWLIRKADAMIEPLMNTNRHE